MSEVLTVKETTKEGDCLYHMLFVVDRLKSNKDGFAQAAEVVAIKGIPSSEGAPPHDTICISCSTGCAVGCRFCATGETTRNTKGSNNPLNFYEMVEQVTVALNHMQGIDPEFGGHQLSVAFMGKGEPGRNPAEVMRAYAHLMVSGIVQRGTISTTGHPGYIQALRDAYRENSQGIDIAPPYLQISLTAPLAEQFPLLYHPGRLRPLPAGEILKAARDFYSPLFAKPTQIAVRVTLIGYEGGCNYDDTSLREMVGTVKFINDSYPLPDGSPPFFIVVARMNESPASVVNNLTSVEPDIVNQVIERINRSGVYARGFGGPVGGGACGTMSGK